MLQCFECSPIPKVSEKKGATGQSLIRKEITSYRIGTLACWVLHCHFEQKQNVPFEIISPHCIVCSSNGCGPAMDQWITLHLNGSDAQRPEAITTKAALPGQKASAFTNSPVSALWWLCTHCLVTRAERQIYIHAAPLPPPPHSWA